MMPHQIRNALQANLSDINNAMLEIALQVNRLNAMNEEKNIDWPPTTPFNFQHSDGSYPYHQLLVAKANALNGLAVLKAAEMKK